MNNVSPIKTPRLTEEEVHATAEELLTNGKKISSIEIYRHIGRGSLTTITNFLKTWRQEEHMATLPALITMPEPLKKSAEELILKVWAESQALADQELKNQQEALRQAEAIANEKITEAQAFSEEQTKQIEQLEAAIEEMKNNFEISNEEWKKQLNEEKQAYQEIFTENKILEAKLKETEKKLKIMEEENKIAKLDLADKTKLQAQLDASKENLSFERGCKNKLENKIYQLECLIGEKKGIEIKAYETANELTKVKTENGHLIAKAAKLEGELSAWKTIQPAASTEEKTSTVKPKKSKIDNNPILA